VPSDPDNVAADLAAIRSREQAATPGPWWFGEDDLMWRLHGVHATIPAQCFPGSDEVMFPEQVINHQILKAPKKGTTYTEYWPGEADAAFIVAARSDVPRLLAAVEAVLALHHPEDRGRVLPCCAFCCTEDECVAWTECPEREAISRALLGEDTPDA
jgi:hypothetical protein